MPIKNISTEKINLILELYKTGKTTHQVAKECGCSQSFVINSLKRNNIERRSIYSYTRKYNMNENYFNIIDTEDKAYFLGLMFADGNNYRSSEISKRHDYQISIKLQSEDKEILDIFIKKLSSNLELKYIEDSHDTWKDGWLLKFDSKIISDQLKQLGCIAAKSLTLKYPTIPAYLQNHFLRGYFDGDGGISCWTKTNKYTQHVNYNWKIVSTKNFCEEAKKIIQSFIDIELYLNISNPDKNNITTNLSTGGNQQVYRLLSWLYKDATIFMKRKYDKFLELEELINKKAEII